MGNNLITTLRETEKCNKCGGKKLDFVRIYLDPYTDYSGWIEKRCRECGDISQANSIVK